ncbi:Exostosin-1 [Seminavis robusta]|uniref:Exostosin-1 n=1 Tax=Seminavis robusta TaxID=568900 RepID=A0A9N8HD57_9STRA|nr:Exostosin-1 [Seminavis robusta]|eukprot:Sro444_g144280.1 Exostosin-1 (417) ;mRNA; f:21392-22642
MQNESFFKLLREPPYFLLHDQTMRLSPHVLRPWLYFDTQFFPYSPPAGLQRPKRKLILTDLAWNHPDQTWALSKFPRSLRMRELLQAYIDHPDFDPTFSWTRHLQRKVDIDPSVEYVVLLDIETCFEINYPKYGANLPTSSDPLGGRLLDAAGDHPCFHFGSCKDYIKRVLQAPLFQQHNNTTSTLVYIDCKSDGPETRVRKELFNSTTQLSVVSLDADIDQLVADADMGLPPPTVKPIILTNPAREAIRNSCQAESHRPYFLTFVGSGGRGPRKELFKLHNGNDVILMEAHEFREQTNETFASLLQKSVFAATPRGDNRYSYRFTEVLSAGGIPVVHSDGWVLPFNPKLVDWTKCAVVIPEARFNETLDILHRIPRNKRCQMRRYCYEIYQNYMVNAEANIAGILDTLDALHGTK